MSKMATALLEVIRQMDPAEAKVFLAAAEAEAERARRPNLNGHGTGSPRDAAVQVYAGEYMRLHRDPTYRKVWLRKLADEQSTFESLGEEAGVSRERARQLYAQLCPKTYDLERRLVG